MQVNQDRSVEDVEYTFGTDSTAASRLADIAKYFNPLAADLIRRFVSNPRDTAVDLGCGPGFTTNMLGEAAGCHQTYGLDSSPEFLDAAAQQFSHCTFLQHDVTEVPFPVTADIMYARFLLCHLRNPLDLVATWVTQLKAGGLLFIDEIDGIDTDLEVFRTYLSMAEGIIATQGASLYVGSVLGTAEYEADVLLNEPSILPVPNWQAASWFFPNTQTIWNENRHVIEHLSPEERKTIGQELHRQKTRRDSQSDITWRLRRVVLRKRTA
jgi:trans-aconitate methyltransferase